MVAVIKKLESSSIPLADTISIIDNVTAKLNNVTCSIGKVLSLRFRKILEENPDFHQMKKINDILIGNSNAILHKDINVNDLLHFKNSVLVSVDAERSFSRYKNLLRDNRRSFKIENLTKHFFINCNSGLLEDEDNEGCDENINEDITIDF